jgi:hypothetical protein
LSQILSNVDWGDPNVISNLNKELEAQGIDISTLGPAWNTYVASMISA